MVSLRLRSACAHGEQSAGIAGLVASGSPRLYTAAFGLAALAAGLALQSQSASALPAYARQTGQTCATCHTAFPELTPFGRQFKLMGYTSGGTRCDDGSAKSEETQVPLAVMAWPATYTSYKNKAANPTSPPNSINDNDWLPGQFSLFVAGQYYCNVGGFAQMTYDRPGNGFSWDLTDIKYARTTVVDGIPLVYGLAATNTPGISDPWNTLNAGFNFPWIVSEVAPTPTAATMLGGNTWGGRVGGVGTYVWVNNMFYAEIASYGALDPRALTDVGVDPTDGTARFSGGAPYWRFAAEKTWDKNSLMIGTFGMYANVTPTNAGLASLNLPGPPQALALGGVTDPFLDIGVDSQYQWIGEHNAVTVRATYVWERQKLSVESALNAGNNPSNQLNDLNINASYIYDRKISATVGYFATWGTSDAFLYGNYLNNSPNSNGWNFDLAYLPFMDGGPDLWPWFNARIGVLYTHYDEFNGTSGLSYATNGSLVKASGNDTVFLYTWLMF
ncbi:MAG: hypothetical protein ACLP7P_10490 [Rhodomicrobium sp.]